jgi:sugar lactone lactonase YvrE
VKIIDFHTLPNARVLAEKLAFPESPRFFKDRLYFTDGPAIRSVNLDGTMETICELPTMQLLGLQIEPDGTIYAGAAFDRKIYRIKGQTFDVVADLSASVTKPNNEFVRLPGGNFLAGNMGFNILAGEPPEPGGLYIVTPDGQVRKTGPDVTFTNAMVLKNDGKTVVMTGDMGSKIYTFSITEAGEIYEWDAITLKGDNPPSADGVAISSGGQLWYSDMHSGAAVKCAPDGSAEIAVTSAVSHATAVWFFEARGREWLVISGIAELKMPASHDEFSGKIAIAPLSEILAN